MRPGDIVTDIWDDPEGGWVAIGLVLSRLDDTVRIAWADGGTSNWEMSYVESHLKVIA